ncbi:MAG: MarR family [Thermoleophilia bacterium]|nr:MarR family [Thermoleophilia bacterium]MCZ4496274.1 MarR family [Thermoleophilia bacterium]
MTQSFEQLMAANHVLTAWRIEHGLTANEGAVLLEIYWAGAIGAAALSRAVGISTASMSRMIARLEGEGWLARSGDERDGRRLLIQPSKRLANAAAGLAGAGPVIGPVVRRA